MDSSGSIGASNYVIMKDFVADVLVTFNITQNSRIAIVTFTTVPTTIVPLATVSDVNDLASTVRGISYSGGGTYTDLALNATLDALTDENNIRIGILLTDGQSNRPELTLIAAAAVHAAGIEMYTFGIGSTNPAELEAIASEPHADYSFYISSFNRSSFNELLLLLARQTCTSEFPNTLAISCNTELCTYHHLYIIYYLLLFGLQLSILNCFGILPELIIIN